MLPSKTFITKLIFICSLAIISAQAIAASHDFCDRYARHALEQFEVAKGEKCRNLKYPVWSMDFKHHYNWCRRVSKTQANQGEEQRLAVLRQCRHRNAEVTADSRERTCRDYASSAVAQQRQNLKRSCGFSGPQWNPNFEDHYNWCLSGGNVRFAADEQQRRQQALANCGSGNTTPGAVSPLPIPGKGPPPKQLKKGSKGVSPLPIPRPALDPGIGI